MGIINMLNVLERLLRYDFLPPVNSVETEQAKPSIETINGKDVLTANFVWRGTFPDTDHAEEIISQSIADNGFEYEITWSESPRIVTATIKISSR